MKAVILLPLEEDAIKKIEEITYRDRQKLLANCVSYADIAKIYGIEPENIQVKISRDNDWYVIYEENDDDEPNEYQVKGINC